MKHIQTIKLGRFKFSLPKQLSAYRVDFLIAFVLSVVIAIASYIGAKQIPEPLITDLYAQDVWFGSDIPTVFGNMSSTDSDFGRNNKHPLFPLFIFPLVFGISKILQVDAVESARILTALVAALWVATLFATLRFMRCHRLDATLFSLLGVVSAATMFWFTVPESFSFGSFTIIAGLAFVALTQYYDFSPIWYILVGLLTVSITITNWMVGFFATAVNFRWKKTIAISVLTILAATALWIAQRVVFTNSGFPFQPGTFIGEKKFITVEGPSTKLAAISSFFYQTLIMPAVQVIDYPLRPGWVQPVVNTFAPGSGSLWGAIAVILWSVLLGLGIWSFFTHKGNLKLRIALGLTIVCQLFIHSIYGAGETFIYSLHFIPLLLVFVAFTSLSRFRLLGLALTAFLVLSVGINNRAQFNQVTATLANYGTPQQRVLSQMQARPADPWLRNEGHILLATPGSDLESKAYHEPGGSFSPGVGSFGVSIWVTDAQGNLKFTSDTIPLEKIQQQFVYSPQSAVPELLTKTEYYQATWSLVKPGSWKLQLSIPKSDVKPLVVIRSVGPAGGAIQSLKLEPQNQGLQINQRWRVTNLPSQSKVYLGDERSPNWLKEQPTVTQFEDELGWGYARIDLGNSPSAQLVIEDPQAESTAALNLTRNFAPLELNLPDSQFAASLNAQITHLLMSLVGDRTRPNDPVNYPLPRLRDGAYQLVALARAGQLDVARKLSPYFAETDFVNSTVPEADIPAVGVWSLASVAEQLKDPAYDQSIWPAVRRKADLIGELIVTNRPGYPTAKASEVPFSEHPDFLKVELSGGNMMATPNLIGIDESASIMSYRALLDAANLGDRLQQKADATRWREQANQLKAAWQKEFEPFFSQVDTTYTSGLWPSGIAASNQQELTQGLQQRWDSARNAQGELNQAPESPHLNLAETHQWLFLNQPDKVWATLRWFWQNQSSPGLFTWWGSNDEGAVATPKSLSKWQWVRGWINPSQVTPHYWTAAEMLLLQLDMLAYVDSTTNSPTLVIGAGVPKEWLNQPFGVKNLRLADRLVNWQWDGKQMNVQIQGEKLNIRLGSAFPANTSVKLDAAAKPAQA